MAGEKFLQLSAGQPIVVVATQSGGSGNENKIPALDSAGRLATTMMPTGIGADTANMLASETLAAGDLVNVWDSTGTRKARKADASNGRRAHGFVLAGGSLGDTVTVYFEGTITGLTSLTIGVPYFLSGSTPGAATATPVTTAGYISQEVGSAISATELSFEPQQPYTLA